MEQARKARDREPGKVRGPVVRGTNGAVAAVKGEACAANKAVAAAGTGKTYRLQQSISQIWSRTMPRGDGTGPAGMGPMTGRAAGICAGNDAPGFMSRAGGRGFWRRGGGRGGGRGWRHWFHATGLPGWRRAAIGGPAFGTPGSHAAPIGPAATKEQELNALKG